jgi:hypothetical protein
MATFQLVFLIQRKGGSPTVSDPENRVGNQDNGCTGKPVYSGLQVPGVRRQCHARARPNW